MFWDEETDRSNDDSVKTEIIDVLFPMTCRSLPINHMWGLSQAILKELPFLEHTKGAGIHQIHVAESNNGWHRPDDHLGLLYPSKRTKLSLRIQETQFEDIKALCGKQLFIDSHEILLGNTVKKKTLKSIDVIFCRHLLIETNQTETDFLQHISTEIKQRFGVTIKKMMCGKRHSIKTPNESFTTTHLMLGDLDKETSIKIQQYGLGSRQTLGCGLFLPHKSITAVKTLK